MRRLVFSTTVAFGAGLLPRLHAVSDIQPRTTQRRIRTLVASALGPENVIELRCMGSRIAALFESLGPM
jgi:hypothetical protein